MCSVLKNCSGDQAINYWELHFLMNDERKSRRSSSRVATKRSLKEQVNTSRSSQDFSGCHRPIAGDAPFNNDCGVLPGE